MATDLANIKTIKANTLTKLASISDPDNTYLTYSENGRSFSWTEYQEHLMRRVQWCDEQLAANEPIEVVTHQYISEQW